MVDTKGLDAPMSVRWRGELVPVLVVLALVNFLMFLPHYLGRMTFPWDFLGGYHAQTYAWVNYPDFLFPGWLPWTDLGFPSFLAVQDGAGYAPFVLLKILGVEYSIRVATVIQASHVAFGGLGVYALVRALGGRSIVAILVALGYQLGAGFYSSQQYSDIVRATAIFPWLLFFFSSRVIVGRWWGSLLASFCLFQFLIAGYPGNIVAAAYGVFFFAAMQFFQSANRLRYLCSVGFAVSAAVLMSMVKWLPLIVNSESLARGNVAANPLEPSLLFTLVFPYDVDFLPSDVAMRSIWLPVVAIWGAFYCNFRSSIGVVGAGLALLAISVACIMPLMGFATSLLPGGGLSRFLVSDWRPVLHLGILLMSAQGWEELLARRLSRSSLIFRTALWFFTMLAVLGVGVKGGYSISESTIPLFMVFGGGVVLLLFLGFSGATTRPSLETCKLVTLSLGLMIVLDGAVHQLSQPRTWRLGWNDVTEAAVLGGAISKKHVHQEVGSGRRPARHLNQTEPSAAIRDATNPSNNQCWYDFDYCVFAYNNLKLSKPHQDFLNALNEEGGRSLLDFVRRPQQLYAADAAGKIGGLNPEDHDSLIVGTDKVIVRGMKYEAGRVEYDLLVSEQVALVENEIWWDGWKGKVCAGPKCVPLELGSTPQALRTWVVPKGEWKVILEYHQFPAWKQFLLFVGGLALACLPVIFRFARRSFGADRRQLGKAL